jgi:hypothetical protein
MIEKIVDMVSKSLQCVFKYFIEKERNHIVHDKGIFENSDQIMSESTLFDGLLKQLELTHCCDEHLIKNVDRFCSFFEKESNQYIVKKLQKTSSSLVASLNELRLFITRRFSGVYDYSLHDGRLCMRPDLVEKVGRSTPEYSELMEELNNHINMIKEKYRKYRRLIKTTLNV